MEEIVKKDKYYKIKRAANKVQVAKVLVDFWCEKCCWKAGKVSECEEVCMEAIVEWLNKEDRK